MKKKSKATERTVSENEEAAPNASKHRPGFSRFAFAIAQLALVVRPQRLLRPVRARVVREAQGAPARVHACMSAHIRARARGRMCARERARTCTHARVYARVCAHTHRRRSSFRCAGHDVDHPQDSLPAVRNAPMQQRKGATRDDPATRQNATVQHATPMQHTTCTNVTRRRRCLCV